MTAGVIIARQPLELLVLLAFRCVRSCRILAKLGVSSVSTYRQLEERRVSCYNYRCGNRLIGLFLISGDSWYYSFTTTSFVGYGG